MKTECIKIVKGFFLIAIIMTGLTQVASAAEISLKVETLKGGGTNIDVPITTDRCEGMGALQFVLTYDPEIVEAESVEAGNILPNGLVEFNVETPGQIRVALISSEPINVSGELLKVRFKLATAKGGRTDLKITQDAAWDYKNNLEMIVTTEDGSLSLSPDPGLIPRGLKIPLMIGGGVLLIVVILIIILARRRKKTQATSTSASTKNTTRESGGGFCEKCGDKHNPGAKFCQKCGQAIDPSA